VIDRAGEAMGSVAMDSDYGAPRELSPLQKARALYRPEPPPCLQVTIVPCIHLLLVLRTYRLPPTRSTPWFATPLPMIDPYSSRSARARWRRAPCPGFPKRRSIDFVEAE
jgi:hypothetical protein